MDVNVVGSRMLEEELRMNLQWEEARLEQMQAQMLRNQELLLEFENGIDNLFVHLHGITVPGQVPAWHWDENSPGQCLVVQWHSAVTLGAATITPSGSFSPPRWLFSL